VAVCALSDTWQLIINTLSNILIQNTQNRESAALHRRVAYALLRAVFALMRTRSCSSPKAFTRV